MKLAQELLFSGSHGGVDISTCTVVLWTDCLSHILMKTSGLATRARSTTTGASVLMKWSPHQRMLPVWPTACWKLWLVTITGKPKPETVRSTNGSKITPSH